MTLMKHCQRFDCSLRHDCYLFDPHPANPLRDYLRHDKIGDECPYYAQNPEWGRGPEVAD